MTDKTSTPNLPPIGWREWASLPQLGIIHIKTKTDTGARTSCLDATNIEPFTADDGRDMVRFTTHPLGRTLDLTMVCEAESLGMRNVTNSGGVSQVRYVIRTVIRMGEYEWPIDITLADRSGMKFRMLLGRTAIAGRFLVNCKGSYHHGKRNFDDINSAYHLENLAAKN